MSERGIKANYNNTLMKIYYIRNDAPYSNVSQPTTCTEENPCQNVQIALDFQALSLEVIKFLSSNLGVEKYIAITFVIMSEDTNFCGFQLKTPLISNIVYELYFTTQNNEIGLECSNVSSLFIEERADISHISFQKIMWLKGIQFKTCFPIDLTVNQTKLVEGGFFFHYFLDEFECQNINQEVGNILIVDSWFNDFLLLTKYVNRIIIKETTISGISSFQFANAKELVSNGVKFSASGVFSSRNVKHLSINNYDGYIGRTYLGGFDNLLMENSEFRANMNEYAVLYIEFGNRAVLRNILVQYNYYWAYFRTINELHIDESRILTNVANFAKDIYSTITITLCEKVTISNSMLFDNTAEIGGSLQIDQFTNVNIINNTFSKCISKARGGAISLESFYQLSRSSVINIIGNTFEDNSSGTYGGAISVTSSQIIVMRNNIFKRNSAVNLGGAIALLSEPDGGKLSECYFEENAVLHSNNQVKKEAIGLGLNSYSGYGGACFILFDKSAYLITSSKFIRNRATKGGAIAGGHVYTNYNSVPSPFIQNCTFIENEAEKTSGQALYLIRPVDRPDFLKLYIDQKMNGDQLFASSPTRFKIIGIEPKNVFPGQVITIKN